MELRGLAWAAVPLLLGLTLGWWALAAAPEEGAAAGEEVVLESGRSVEDDFYGAGRSVGLLGDVAGDAMVAGENVTVTGSVGGDVLAAGRTVAVEGPVEGDVRVAGQDVIINGRVGRAVTAFGSRLAVAKGASIGRTLLAFGERLEVRGAVGRDLRAFAETVLISGRVAGDVDVEADHLIIAEGARVEGDVRYTGPVKPEVAPGSVAGQVIYRPRAPEARPTPLAQLAAQFLALGRFLLLTLALAFFAGQGIRTLTDRLLARPWRSLGVGALSLVLVPLVVVALALTVVGSSAAWAVALSFVGLVVGSAGLFKAVLAVVVGRWLWRLLGKRWNLPDGEQLLWPAAVGALAVFVLTAVPGLGFLVGLVALLGLLGALLALLWEGAVSWPLRGRP